MNQHATAIRWKNTGMIFTGPPGCGKSSLALDLIERGATLIADDQIILTQKNGHWYASRPEAIKNKLHLRDIGLLHLESIPETKIDFIFQSVSDNPLPAPLSETDIPVMSLDFMIEPVLDFIERTIGVR